MTTLDRSRWQQISPFLDQALAMPAEELSAWLDSLRDTDPDVAFDLQSLLEEHRVLENESFLEHSPLPPADQPTLSGQIVGAYRLVSLVGQGGMGSVWLAERVDGRFDRKVALKFLNVALVGHGGEERFKREGKILGQLSHPHIAELLDAGVSATGQPYLVLGYVEGERIDRYCDDHKLDVAARIRLFLDVLAAVAHAHAHLIVHRDIKPSNVLVTANGQVKLLDFGVAKLLEHEGQLGAATKLTQEAGSALTLEYAAPEQVTGGAVTTATDVYALGVLLGVLLTGQHPAGPGPHSTASLIKAIVETEPPRLSDVVARRGAEAELTNANATARNTSPERLRRTLRGDLDTIISKALKKKSEERYASATALSDDLEGYLRNEPIGARPDTVAYRAAKFVRRNRTAVTLASLALIVTIGGVAGTLYQARLARKQRDSAVRERDRASRITEFMAGMFKVSDPTESRGNSITAREILDKASKEIDAGLKSDPQTQAQLMDVMGNVYGSLGLYAKAQPLLKRAVEIEQTVLGPKNQETLRSTNDLAQLLTTEGRYTEGEKLDRETLATRRQMLGPENPETLTSMRLLAWTLQQEGRFSESEKLASETLEIERRVLGSEHQDTLATLANLSWTLRLEGHFSEAEKYGREALEGERLVLGLDHPKTLSAINTLAATLSDEGRYAESEKLDREALDLEGRVLGAEHPSTLATANNLAWALRREGRYDEAEKLYRETLDIELRVLGPEHPTTLRIMSNLASALGEEGKFAEAEKYSREALDAERRVLGHDHPSTLRTLNALAEILRKAGHYSEAEKVQLETLNAQRRVLGVDDPSTAISIYNLAALRALQGYKEEALSLLRDAVDHGLPPFLDLEIENDPDFKSIRINPCFATLVGDAKERAAASIKPD